MSQLDIEVCDLQVSLLMDNGNTKDDLRLPTDEQLLTQVSKFVVNIVCFGASSMLLIVGE